VTGAEPNGGCTFAEENAREHGNDFHPAGHYSANGCRFTGTIYTPISRTMKLFKQIERLFGSGIATGCTDGQLLERFVHERDEAAFTALVDRHGAMVLRVCRQILGNEHDAQDASQKGSAWRPTFPDIGSRTRTSASIRRSLAGSKE
jgi:hypothetical protein